jgi:catechol 2,3-dioxygenase-like lactoylglutathione lyase family enzyme
MPPETAVNLGTLTNTLIQCTDFDASLAFYTGKLGLTIQARGDAWAVLDSGSGVLVLYGGDEPQVIMGFTGADLDGARAVMEQRGAQPSERQAHPGGEHFIVRDPEGNAVMIAD